MLSCPPVCTQVFNHVACPPTPEKASPRMKGRHVAGSKGLSAARFQPHMYPFEHFDAIMSVEAPSPVCSASPVCASSDEEGVSPHPGLRV